jgi:hypothetical protein
MQDAIAIAVAVASGLWLVRTLWRQMMAPSCGKGANPAGADGFVPLGDLSATAPKETGAT